MYPLAETHRPVYLSLKYPGKVLIYRLIISQTVIPSSSQTGSSLRVIIEWWPFSYTSQHPVQKWTACSIHCIRADQLVLRALLIPQDNFKRCSSPHGPISVDDKNCQTRKHSSTRGRLHNVRKKFPKWQSKARLLNQLKSPVPGFVLENLCFCTEESETVDSCFLISEAGKLSVSYLFNKKLPNIACTTEAHGLLIWNYFLLLVGIVEMYLYIYFLIS